MGAGASASAVATSSPLASSGEIFQLLTPELKRSLAVAAKKDPQAFESAVQSIRSAAAALSNNTATTPTDSPLSIQEQVVLELNACRTNPKAYAQKIKATAKFYKGFNIERPNETTLITNEGMTALNECVLVLEQTPPMPPFELPMSVGLRQAAQAHCDDTGPLGITGHAGSDQSQPADRMNRFGLWKGGCAENISYGHDDPFRIVEQLLRDDGVPSRGHRKNILTPTFIKIGVALGSHKTYKKMCTQNFANDYRDGASSFDRTKPFAITTTAMTKELTDFLSIVPFEQIVSKVATALKEEGNTVKLNYTPPGSLAVSIENSGGSQSFNCSFG
jgi:uncharacterized protein YkwD